MRVPKLYDKAVVGPPSCGGILFVPTQDPELQLGPLVHFAKKGRHAP